MQLADAGLAPTFELIEQLRAVEDRAVRVHENVSVSRDPAGRLTVQKSSKTGFQAGAMRIHLAGGAGEMAFDKARISWKIRKRASGTFRAPMREVNNERFDADKLGRDIVLRYWQPGDRFQPIGMARAVKLQDLFTNQKISRAARTGVMVGTAVDGEVFWVEGMRIGERFKLDKDTRYELNWRWKRL